MKVVEHIDQAKSPIFSFEIVPPPRGRSIQDIIEIADTLAPLKPSWIDVTAHASNIHFVEHSDGSIEKKTFKKRPGTMSICGIIQNRFKIDTVAHMLCEGFTKDETEDALIELNYLGIHNVLALKGDAPNYKKDKLKTRACNSFASDLVKQISDLKKGNYLEDLSDSSPLDFCVGVAGYPEKHFEAPNEKSDLTYLKKKVDAGAEYIVTQMFFDNSKYFSFVSKCRDMGIHVPIVPGIKIMRSVAQLKSLPKNFYIDIPDELADEVTKNPDHAAEVGKRWAQKQVEELISKNAPGVHFYIMNDATLVYDVVKRFQK